MKLIAYHSNGGNTKHVANIIKGNIEADILEIEPVKKLPKNKAFKVISGVLQTLSKKKPDLKHYDVDVSKYDEIYLGFPIWASNYSAPIRTFLEKENLQNKEINLFICHSGDMGDEVVTEIKTKYKVSKVIDFKNVLKENDEVESKIKNWLGE